MSIRRKGRELVLMALFAIDGVPAREQHRALQRFWVVFQEPEVWKALFAEEPTETHPLQEPSLWVLFDHLPLLPPRAGEPPFRQAQDAKEFAQKCVEGFILEGSEIDRAISKASKGWRLQRMSQVDRNILRLGAYEILYVNDVPPAVAINEAIELSKVYSSTKAASFINGVLDRIRRNRNN